MVNMGESVVVIFVTMLIIGAVGVGIWMAEDILREYRAKKASGDGETDVGNK